VRAAILIARNDLRRRLRDRTALVIAFVAPFGLAGIMGVTFGSGDNTALVRVAIADVENTTQTNAFIDKVLESLSLGNGVAVVRLTDTAEAEKLYNEHRVSAAIEVLPGSAARIRHAQPPLITRQSSRTRPLGKAVADGFFAAATVRQLTVRLVADTLANDKVPVPQILEAATAVANGSPSARIVEDRLARRASPLGYYATAMGIVFLFLSVGGAANSILAELTTGTMARLQAAPTSLASVVAGKTISILSLMLASMLSLWGATTLFFGAQWGDPLGVFALIVATTVAVAAIGLFVTVSAKTEAMAQAATGGVAFVLAIFGGNFFPPGSLPPALEKLSLLTPNGWALDGFTTLTLDAGRFGDIVRPLVVLSVIALVVGAAALARFRRVMAVA
jgi:ABC-2 type transport system permease protein